MLIQKYLTKTNYTKGILKKNKYIVLHYTANNGDTAWGNCNYFHKENRGASANYFVDETSIWQCVEDNDIAWHVGTNKGYKNGCRNNNSIGIEMCSRKDSSGTYYIKPETVANTIELVKYLIDKYKITNINTQIVRHFDVTGKRCPEPWVRDPAQWINFLKALEVKEDEERRKNL